VAVETISKHASFGGTTGFYRHASSVNSCTMQFAVFTPPQAADGPVPVLTYLAGLTCSEETFMIKAGAQRIAAELGLAIVCPDTSPRGTNLPGEDDSYDFGSGAGFYVNATRQPWSKHYHMYDYVTRELPELVERELPLVPGLRAISGHSMGGHGALILALRRPGHYRAVSAFAPVVNPSECPWGQKAFSGYLGEDRGLWTQYDACELVARGASSQPLFIDQGEADDFLEQQLCPERLEAVCAEHDHPLTLRRQPGYDHSYYFIATFIEEHLRYHAERLKKR